MAGLVLRLVLEIAARMVWKQTQRACMLRGTFTRC
jgi:hypothetical protein